MLFAYATSHLIGHASGLFRLEAMDRVGRFVVLAPWRTLPGQVLLGSCFLVHAGLGLLGFVRRRHLSMPPTEAVQFGLGLVIPLLLLPHVVNVRLGAAMFGLDDSYFRLVYQYWITSPLVGLSRQFALLVALWVHGCLGLHMLLRFRGWYARWSGVLLAGAVALPVLAMLGIMNAGWDTQMRAMLEPGFAAQHGPPPTGSADAVHLTILQHLWARAQLGYLAMLVGVVALRSLLLRRRRGRGFVVTHAGCPVQVPQGYSLLDASRLGRLPLAAMCGGRARCSTCRVQVLAGGDRLPPASSAERSMLQRIGAPPDVRLACQTYPLADVAVRPLVPVEGRAGRYGIAFAEGLEHIVTAMAIDLRDSTQLAEANLPFDTLYLVNRYLSAVLEIVGRQGGYVTSVAGDGVMCVFGLSGSAAEGARNAFTAAREVWTALRALDGELADDLRAPIRFGIGLHSGVAVIGAVARSGRASLQFLGDTGNVASRLEALTKDKKCVVIASQAVVDAAELPGDTRLRVDYVSLRGRQAPLPIALFRERGELSALLDSIPTS